MEPLATLTSIVLVAAVAAPPAALFRRGANLCRAAPLAAIRKAGAQRYAPGIFRGGVCTWERADLRAGITLSAHPAQAGAELIRSFSTLDGKNGFETKPIRVHGASKALLVTLPASEPNQVSKYLFAAYPPGVIQVNMTAPRRLPDARIVAVLEAVVSR